jgi:DNA-binding IclR family transcriptional regulator
MTTLSVSAAKVLAFIESHPGTTTQQITRGLKMANSTVRAHTAMLKKLEYIERGNEIQAHYTATSKKFEARTIREQAEPSDPAIIALMHAVKAMVAMREDA